MTIFDRISAFVQRVFKTNLDIFLEALQLSPNAQGYVSGSITELLLKEKLEKGGYEVRRIREKWEGRKHPRHHGDFYFRRFGETCWYVLESKGVKSNSEKWHKLYNFENLKKFLITYGENLPWIDPTRDTARQVSDWIYDNLPKFRDVYASSLYDYQEIQKYTSARQTEKAIAIAALRGYSREQINEMIDERLVYVMSRVKVLEIHFVSGTSETSERTQATPRKDEFNVVAIDIVLRFSEHKFVFANPQNLDSSGSDPNHLRQNYIMGFVFTGEDGKESVQIGEEWYDDFEDVVALLDPADCVAEEDMQIDNRYSGINNRDE